MDTNWQKKEGKVHQQAKRKMDTCISVRQEGEGYTGSSKLQIRGTCTPAGQVRGRGEIDTRKQITRGANLPGISKGTPAGQERRESPANQQVK
jgi:hypothetical protein